MGIDLYIYRVVKQNAINDFEMLDEHSENVKEIAYLKNHRELKEWFEYQYIYKGGFQPKFNDAYMRLTLDDLQEIEEEFIRKTPPFPEKIYNFVMDARKAITEGFEIYVYCVMSS